MNYRALLIIRSVENLIFISYKCKRYQDKYHKMNLDFYKFFTFIYNFKVFVMSILDNDVFVNKRRLL